MRRAVVLLLVAVVAGCGGSSDAEPQAVEETPETEGDTADLPPPRSYEEVMARLPPLDVPASADVEAYRKSTIGAFFDRCVNARAVGLKARFVKANRAMLADVPVPAGARKTGEYSIDHGDGNGCPEGLGPPTYFTTYRSYSLPGGTRPAAVLEYYRSALRSFTPSGYTPCEQTFVRGDAYVAVSACNGTLRLTAKAMERVEPPPPSKPPPRPYGAQYPLVEDDVGIPEPTSYEVESGESCERKPGGDVPSIIIPPTPGIRAEWATEPLQLGASTLDEHVVVEWSFEKILGDCPPTLLYLTLPNPTPGNPPFGIHVDVRARSGTEHLPVPESFREAYILWATAESIDGHRGRSVAILIRR
jgi:hypothetical protein